MRLLALALHRLLWFVPTLLGLLVVTFVISRVVPADPVALVAGETATPAQIEALRRDLGFDRPLRVELFRVPDDGICRTEGLVLGGSRESSQHERESDESVASVHVPPSSLGS